jgi:hypothetical protein
MMSGVVVMACLRGETPLEESVVYPFAPGGVADNGVRDVFEMAPQLVLAAGFGREFEQGISRMRVTIDGRGNLDGRQSAKAGERRPGRRAIRRRQLASVVVEAAAQGMVDPPAFRRPAAHDGEVALDDFVALELAADDARALGVEREQQYAGGALVEAVHRMDMAANLVAQELHGEARFVAVEVAAMDQQAGGLVYGDEVIVAVEDIQHAARAAQYCTPCAAQRNFISGAAAAKRSAASLTRPLPVASEADNAARPMKSLRFRSSIAGCPAAKPRGGRVRLSPASAQCAPNFLSSRTANQRSGSCGDHIADAAEHVGIGMPAAGAEKAFVGGDVQVEAGRMDVLAQFVAELDADVGLVGRLVAGKARVAEHAHQRAAHLARLGAEVRGEFPQWVRHGGDEFQRRLADQCFVAGLVGLEPGPRRCWRPVRRGSRRWPC